MNLGKDKGAEERGLILRITEHKDPPAKPKPMSATAE
jgi:hypothetical protein